MPIKKKYSKKRKRKSYTFLAKINGPVTQEGAWFQLATDVLSVAVYDWTYADEGSLDWQLLIDFFTSAHFDDICTMARVNPDVILEGLGIKTRYLDRIK